MGNIGGYSKKASDITPKENAEKVKTFSFNSKNIQENFKEAQKLQASMEGFEGFSDKNSMISGKNDGNMSEMNQSKFSKSINEEKNQSYAAKKMQKKELNTKKPSKKEVGEEKPKDNAEGKIEANANLKHLLLD